jgi:Tol biopolymer transport system component
MATIQIFLARLTSGQVPSAVDLFLTEEAKSEQGAEIRSRLANNEVPITQATLVTFSRTADELYRATADLQWASSQIGTQTITATLVYEQGLWLISDLSLGKRRGATPTPAARAAQPTLRRTEALDGKLVFQTSSGGDIYWIHADGSGLRRLTDGLDPALSPDGNRVGFSRWRQPWGIYTLDLASNTEERLTDGSRLRGVTWAPDGSRIAYTFSDPASEPVEYCYLGYCVTIPPQQINQLWLANLETGKLLSLPLEPEAIQAPVWNPTSDQIAFANSRGLAWIDLDGMRTGRFDSSMPWDTSPSFSPDGSQIAFMGRVHDEWHIFVMSSDGTGRRQLTHREPERQNPPRNVAPAWSPDGTNIAFLSDRDGRWRIYVMRSDGSEQRSMFGGLFDDVTLSYDWASERVLSWSP